MPPSSPQGDRRASISVVVPVHDGAGDLDRCLAALSRSTRAPLECIVVDDASRDDAVDVARSHGARVLELDAQRGPAHARNRGAEMALGDVLFFTDADVIVHPDTLERAVTLLESDSDVDAVIGSYDAEPTDPSFVSQYKNLFHHWVHQTSQEEASTFWTACGAVRRDLFLNMGGFNESYERPSMEDIEFGFRLRRAGRRIRLDKELTVTHTKHWRFWRLLYTDVFRRGIPWIALMLRDRFAPEDLNLSRESKLGTLFAFGLVLSIVGLAATGHALAALPILAALGAASLCAFLREPGRRATWRTLLGVALVVTAPTAALMLGPDPLALMPFTFWVGVMLTHRRLYAFMKSARGVTFACAVTPMHILFLLSCGVCVPFGIVAHALDRRRARRRSTGPGMRELEPLTLPTGRSQPGGAGA